MNDGINARDLDAKDLDAKDLNARDLNGGRASRGGRRQGAGRPKSFSKLYTFRAPKELVPFIEEQPSKSDFFKVCISRAAAGSAAKADAGGVAKADAGSVAKVELEFGRVVPAERVRPLSLPFFDIGIVAGFPVPLDNDERAQDIELLRMLCPNPEASYLIRVEGNSMIDAGIFSGDIVIVDKSNRNPRESEVAVCEFNGEYTLKRFVQRDGAGWLVPANPDYPQIRVTPDDSFSIWGTVTYIIHKPRG